MEALRTVEELCQGKKSCSMITSPVSLGVKALDPCPGIRSALLLLLVMLLQLINVLTGLTPEKTINWKQFIKSGIQDNGFR